MVFLALADGELADSEKKQIAKSGLLSWWISREQFDIVSIYHAIMDKIMFQNIDKLLDGAGKTKNT